MKRVTRDTTMANFDRTLAPAIEIEPGERVAVETNLGAKPATGPIAVRGAEPGDTLVVTIESVLLTEAKWWWWSDFGSPFRQGVYKKLDAHLTDYPRVQHRLGNGIILTVPMQDGHVVFNERVKVPIRPVIGTIGVAPAGDAQATNLAGRHGGNLDFRLGAGTRIFFPVAAAGGLLGLCDVHAAHPDGGLLPAIECTSEVILSAAIKKQVSLPVTFIETDDAVQAIGTGKTVEEASEDALAAMMQVVQDQLRLTYLEAAWLVGTAAHLHVCQFVDPVIIMRVSMPKISAPGLLQLDT
jgi:amidase